MDFEFSIFKHLKIFIMLFNEKNLSLRKLLCSIGIVAVAQFMSCETDDVEEARNESSSPQQEQKEEPSLNYKALFSSNHTMGMDEARELALDAASLFAGEGNGLKSGRARQIEEVRVLHSDETTLRSGSGEVVAIPDTLAYVCNFADSAGFAIICADDRVGCPILACVDNGTLGEDTDNPGLAIFLDNAQVFMRNSIMKFEMEKDSLLEVAKREIEEKDSLPRNELRRVYAGTYTLLRGVEEVKPLLKTTWGQGVFPYNASTPKCVCHGKQTKAGCWATAIAQVMAYYRYPKEVSDCLPHSPSFEMDWEEMTASADANDVKYSSQCMISVLLYFIGRNIDMDYGCDGSSAKPRKAMSYLKKIGYSGCDTKDYSFSAVKTQLDNRRPVLMTGERKKVLFVTYKGHAWVVDGYSAASVEYYYYTLDTNTGRTSNRRFSSGYENSLFHINWGWMGSNNGYFAAGCFNCSNSEKFDRNTDNNNSYNYQYDLEIHPAWR
jgi:hypothetical protein